MEEAFDLIGMSEALFTYGPPCSQCGTRHLDAPCSYPCVCRCRKCDARLHCRGTPEAIASRLSALIREGGNV